MNISDRYIHGWIDGGGSGFIYSGMLKGQRENMGGVLKLESHSFETMGKRGASTSRQWLLN